MGYPLAFHGLNGFHPADRMPSLAYQSILDGFRVCWAEHIYVINHWANRCFQSNGLKGSLKGLRSRPEQFRMKGSRYRQQQGPARALRLGGFASLLNGSTVTGNDHLSRCIEIYCLHQSI